MLTVEQLPIKDIKLLNYFDLIGIVKETNRPPGGIDSIIEIAQNTFLNKNSKVLEIGTSTGFTAIELAKLTQCQVVAIDVNQNSLNEAIRRSKIERVNQYISFENQDAAKLNYADETFDMVFCGNVTSYLNNKSDALKEFIRILKPNGFIAALPMYYLETPPDKIVNQVSNAINHKIDVRYKNDWLDFFNVESLSAFTCTDFQFDYVTSEAVMDFVEQIFQQEHLNRFSNQELTDLKERYQFFLNLFRTNLSLMGFSALLLRKVVEVNDPVLFTASKVIEVL